MLTLKEILMLLAPSEPREFTLTHRPCPQCGDIQVYRMDGVFVDLQCMNQDCSQPITRLRG